MFRIVNLSQIYFNRNIARFLIEEGSIDDPGVSGHEGFNGEMSKYETTNAQYCQFLNEALASGDISIDTAHPNFVFGANGSNNGDDFVGQVYFDLNASISCNPCDISSKPLHYYPFNLNWSILLA